MRALTARSSQSAEHRKRVKARERERRGCAGLQWAVPVGRAAIFRVDGRPGPRTKCARVREVGRVFAGIDDAGEGRQFAGHQIARLARPRNRPGRPDGDDPAMTAPWRVPLLEARRQCVASMSEAERADMRAGQAAARIRSQERKEAARDLMRRILALHNDGASDGEIGKAVGMSARRVREFAAQRGVLITRSEGKVHRGLTIGSDREVFLRRLATDHKATPAKTIEELVAAVLEHDAAVARKVLGVRKGAACAQSVVVPVREAREALTKGRAARRRAREGDGQPATIGEARAALQEEIAARRAQQEDGRLATVEDFLSGAPGANFIMAASGGTSIPRRRPS